jgi:hypothetical protein
MTRRRFVRSGTPCVLGAAAVIALAANATAVDYFWTDTTEGGDVWNDANNWVDPLTNTNAIPGANDAGRIDNGGIAIIDDSQTVAVGFAEMGPNAGTTGTLRMTGGMLTTNFDIRVGGRAATGGGTGTMDQSGGTIFMNGGNFVVGFGSGDPPNGVAAAVGIYNLSGGSVKVNSGTIFAVGNRGNGTVNQTGGSFYVRGASAPGTGFIQLGRNAVNATTGTGSGSGTYTLSGGDLTAARLLFGAVDSTNGRVRGGPNTFNLQGSGVNAGRLVTGEISILDPGATNTFNFTGGTLQTNTVNISLTNQGGTLSPATLNFGTVGVPGSTLENAADVVAAPAGVTTFTGTNNYTQQAGGRYLADVGPSNHDQVAVGGTLTLAGQLEIRTAEGFVPAPLQEFDKVMTWGTREGTFDSVTGQQAAPDRFYAPIYRANELDLVVTIPGDANLDGMVDVTDLGILATTFNDTGTTWTEGDFSLDNQTNVTDLGLLATNYNRSIVASGMAGPSFEQAMAMPQFANLAAALPEPAALALLGLAGVGMLSRRRRA